MNQRVNDPLMLVVKSFVSLIQKDIVPSLQQGQLAFSREQPAVWNLSTQWHTAGVTLQVETDGSMSMSLNLSPIDSTKVDGV